MKSDKDDAIDAIGGLSDDDITKLYGDCNANSDGVKKVTQADPDDRRDAMVDAIADDYLDDNTNDLAIDDWLPMKLPKKT